MHKVLFYYYCFSVVILLFGIVYVDIYNNWNYNLFFFATLLVFTWFYSTILRSKADRKIVYIFFVGSTLVFLYYNLLLFRFFSAFNSLVYATTFISVVFYALMYFRQSLLDIKEESILLNFNFWLNSAYLLYFLGSFVIVLFYEGATPRLRGDIWSVHNFILLFTTTIVLKGHLLISNKERNQ